MDLLATPGACRRQAARCQTLAETAGDQRVRPLLVSMKEGGPSWLTRAERLNKTNTPGRRVDEAGLPLREVRNRGNAIRARDR
jgi:hypothetical protein